MILASHRASHPGVPPGGARMRPAFLSSLALLVLAPGAALGLQRSDSAPGRVVLERKRIVLVRTGQLARQFPARKQSVVILPFVRSHPDAEVLRKVRALLAVENLFGTSLAEYKQDAWLTELSFKLNYNRNHILDLTIWQSGIGAYPDTHTKHLAIDLKRGEVIKAADVFKPESLATLAGMVNERLQAEARRGAEEWGGRQDVSAEEKQHIREMLAGLSFGVADLDEMMITDRGVTFLYDAGFPHVVEAVQPRGEYLFSYRQLAPHIRRDGLLGQFVS